MQMLSRVEYSQNFDNWAESTRENYANRIDEYSDASHQTVADTIAAIYNLSVASKLVNKAMDAGIRFDGQEFI